MINFAWDTVFFWTAKTVSLNIYFFLFRVKLNIKIEFSKEVNFVVFSLSFPPGLLTDVLDKKLDPEHCLPSGRSEKWSAAFVWNLLPVPFLKFGILSPAPVGRYLPLPGAGLAKGERGETEEGQVKVSLFLCKDIQPNRVSHYSTILSTGLV